MGRQIISRIRASAGIAIIFALVQPALAHAQLFNPAGLYVGGEIGGARTGALVPDSAGGGEYFENRGGFQFMAGVHPVLLPLGAELAYVDLGNLGDDGNSYYSARLKLHGPAAFATLYLPVPLIDVYLKAGAARLNGALEGYSPFNRGSIHTDYSGTHFAGGVGTNIKFGALALRAEYEFFNAAGETQQLLAAGVVWTF